MVVRGTTAYLVAVVVGWALGASPGPCPSKESLLADTVDCSVYYNCSFSDLVRQTCPPHQVFHPLAQICGPPSSAGCKPSTPTRESSEQTSPKFLEKNLSSDDGRAGFITTISGLETSSNKPGDATQSVENGYFKYKSNFSYQNEQPTYLADLSAPGAQMQTESTKTSSTIKQNYSDSIHDEPSTVPNYYAFSQITALLLNELSTNMSKDYFRKPVSPDLPQNVSLTSIKMNVSSNHSDQDTASSNMQYMDEAINTVPTKSSALMHTRPSKTSPLSIKNDRFVLNTSHSPLHDAEITLDAYTNGDSYKPKSNLPVDNSEILTSNTSNFITLTTREAPTESMNDKSVKGLDELFSRDRKDFTSHNRTDTLDTNIMYAQTQSKSATKNYTLLSLYTDGWDATNLPVEMSYFPYTEFPLDGISVSEINANKPKQPNNDLASEKTIASSHATIQNTDLIPKSTEPNLKNRKVVMTQSEIHNPSDLTIHSATVPPNSATTGSTDLSGQKFNNDYSPYTYGWDAKNLPTKISYLPHTELSRDSTNVPEIYSNKEKPPKNDLPIEKNLDLHHITLQNTNLFAKSSESNIRSGHIGKPVVKPKSEVQRSSDLTLQSATVSTDSATTGSTLISAQKFPDLKIQSATTPFNNFQVNPINMETKRTLDLALQSGVSSTNHSQDVSLKSDTQNSTYIPVQPTKSLSSQMTDVFKVLSTQKPLYLSVQTAITSSNQNGNETINVVTQRSLKSSLKSTVATRNTNISINSGSKRSSFFHVEFTPVSLSFVKLSSENLSDSSVDSIRMSPQSADVHKNLPFLNHTDVSVESATSLHNQHTMGSINTLNKLSTTSTVHSTTPYPSGPYFDNIPTRNLSYLFGETSAAVANQFSFHPASLPSLKPQNIATGLTYLHSAQANKTVVGSGSARYPLRNHQNWTSHPAVYSPTHAITESANLDIESAPSTSFHSGAALSTELGRKVAKTSMTSLKSQSLKNYPLEFADRSSLNTQTYTHSFEKTLFQTHMPMLSSSPDLRHSNSHGFDPSTDPQYSRSQFLADVSVNSEIDSNIKGENTKHVANSENAPNQTVANPFVQPKDVTLSQVRNLFLHTDPVYSLSEALVLPTTNDEFHYSTSVTKSHLGSTTANFLPRQSAEYSLRQQTTSKRKDGTTFSGTRSEITHSTSLPASGSQLRTSVRSVILKKRMPRLHSESIIRLEAGLTAPKGIPETASVVSLVERRTSIPDETTVSSQLRNNILIKAVTDSLSATRSSSPSSLSRDYPLDILSTSLNSIKNSHNVDLDNSSNVTSQRPPETLHTYAIPSTRSLATTAKQANLFSVSSRQHENNSDIKQQNHSGLREITEIPPLVAINERSATSDDVTDTSPTGYIQSIVNGIINKLSALRNILSTQDDYLIPLNSRTGSRPAYHPKLLFNSGNGDRISMPKKLQASITAGLSTVMPKTGDKPTEKQPLFVSAEIQSAKTFTNQRKFLHEESFERNGTLEKSENDEQTFEEIGNFEKRNKGYKQMEPEEEREKFEQESIYIEESRERRNENGKFQGRIKIHKEMNSGDESSNDSEESDSSDDRRKKSGRFKGHVKVRRKKESSDESEETSEDSDSSEYRRKKSGRIGVRIKMRKQKESSEESSNSDYDSDSSD